MLPLVLQDDDFFMNASLLRVLSKPDPFGILFCAECQ